MGEFLHGWRRKVGVVALLLACLLTIGWFRSLYFQEHLVFPIGRDTVLRLFSFYGSFCVCKTKSDSNEFDGVYCVHSHRWIQSDDPGLQATIRFKPQLNLDWSAQFWIDEWFHTDWQWAGFGTGQLTWPHPPLALTYTKHGLTIISAEEAKRLEIEEHRQELRDHLCEEVSEKLQEEQEVFCALVDTIWNVDAPEVSEDFNEFASDVVSAVSFLVANLAEISTMLAEGEARLNSSTSALTDIDQSDIDESTNDAGDGIIQTDHRLVSVISTSASSTTPRQQWLLIAVPYYFIVLPLSLLSFWLLLSNSRSQRKSRIRTIPEMAA